MKKIYIFLMTMFSLATYSQGNEDFTNLPTSSSTSYTNRTWTGTNNVVWTAEGARTDQNMTGKSICFGTTTNGSRKVTSPTYAGGLGTLTFNYVRAFSGTGARSIEVYVNNVIIGTPIVVPNNSDVVQIFNQEINIIGNVIVEIRSVGASQVKIDDISWTGYSENGPAASISVNPTTISGLDYVFENGPSLSSSFSVLGTNFTTETGNIYLSASTNFEISSNNISFSDDLLIPFENNELQSQLVYARLKSGLSAGDYSGSITVSGGGITNIQSISLNGTITLPAPPFALPYTNGFNNQNDLDLALEQGFNISNASVVTSAGGYLNLTTIGASHITTPLVFNNSYTATDFINISFSLATFGSGNNREIQLQRVNQAGQVIEILNSYFLTSSTYINETFQLYLNQYNEDFALRLAYTNGTGGSIRFRNLNIVEVESFLPIIMPTSCNTTIENVQYDRIYAEDYVNVNQWKFKIQNGSENYNVIRNVDYVHFFDFLPNIEYGTTYQVSVSVKVNNVWTSFGPSCPIAITAEPKTDILYNTCGTTLPNIASNITLKPVDLANMYRITVKNMTTNVEVSMDQSSRLFRLSNFSNTAYNTAFEVKAQVSIDGGITFFAANTPCIITTPALPVSAPNLAPASCGITIPRLNADIYTPWVNDNAVYCFNVSVNGTFVEEVEMPTRRFRLTDLTVAPQMGVTYTLKVRIKLFGSYTDYGISCDIFTPSVPLAQLSNATCNSNIAGFGTTLRAGWVNSQVNAFKFAIVDENMNILSEVERSTEDVNLTLFPGITPQLGTTYLIRVKVRIGSSWGEYGNTCSVTTPGGSQTQTRNLNHGEPTQPILVYPNPFNDSFKVKIAPNSNASIQVFEINGRLILSKAIVNESEIILGNEFTNGVYFLVIEQDGKVNSFKIIKE